MRLPHPPIHVCPLIVLSFNARKLLMTMGLSTVSAANRSHVSEMPVFGCRQPKTVQSIARPSHSLLNHRSNVALRKIVNTIALYDAPYSR